MSHRRHSPLLLVLLLAGMVALGLWSARPPPPRNVDDPQPVIQVYRRGAPKDLLLALPLRPADEVRLVAEAPLALKPALFWSEPDGALVELRPLDIRQSGKLLQVAHPVLAPKPLSSAAGTKVALLVCGAEAPRVEDVAECLGRQAWPRLPKYFLIQFTPKVVELTGPRGPKLPPPEETQAIESRLRAAATRLRARFPFFVGVAVPCE
jgi:hypothetical protein